MDKFTVFKIGDEEFGISIDNVVEILRTQKVFPLPELPVFLSGVINVRGDVIPVLDLRIRFGIDISQTSEQIRKKKERVIIFRYEDSKLGLMTDEIKEIISIAPEDISPPPPLFKGLRTEYLSGLGKKEDRIIILLNLSSLLTAEEKIALIDSSDSFKEENMLQLGGEEDAGN